MSERDGFDLHWDDVMIYRSFRSIDYCGRGTAQAAASLSYKTLQIEEASLRHVRVIGASEIVHIDTRREARPPGLVKAARRAQHVQQVVA